MILFITLVITACFFLVSRLKFFPHFFTYFEKELEISLFYIYLFEHFLFFILSSIIGVFYINLLIYSNFCVFNISLVLFLWIILFVKRRALFEKNLDVLAHYLLILIMCCTMLKFSNFSIANEFVIFYGVLIFFQAKQINTFKRGLYQIFTLASLFYVVVLIITNSHLLTHFDVSLVAEFSKFLDGFTQISDCAPEIGNSSSDSSESEKKDKDKLPKTSFGKITTFFSRL
jgi:hypothetical protein